jgi:hypothetical protein
MNRSAMRLFWGAGIVAMLLMVAAPLDAQVANATISGAVTDTAGRRVPGADISVENVTTGEIVEGHADSSGDFTVANLSPGDYEVKCSAPGLASATNKVTLAAGAAQTVNLSLSAPQVQPGTPPAPENSGAPSLSDLGFTPDEVQANAALQARLDKRAHMLKIHQRLGLITLIPMTASIASSGFAGRRSGWVGRDVHMGLGSVTADLYCMTAYYAIRAPKIPGTQTRGPIKFHKAMAWIHGPGMILTPILGAIAYDQESKGEKVHGIAAAHSAVAIVTYSAFAAAVLSVSFKF